MRSRGSTTPKTEAAAGRTTSQTVERTLDRLSERGIRFLDLRFVDVLGTVKSITIRKTPRRTSDASPNQ